MKVSKKRKTIRALGVYTPSNSRNSTIDPFLPRRRVSDPGEALTLARRYLERYWSVGILRFYEDMEALGVPRDLAEDALRRLVDEGTVSVSRLGVINMRRDAR